MFTPLLQNMAEEISHNKTEGTKEMTISTSNTTDIDISTAHKLSSMLLNEFNFLPWSRAITIALGGRSKLGFINGTIKAPAAGTQEHEA